MNDAEIQRAYYTATAANYDALHGAETPVLALAFLDAAVNALGAKAMLDVGSGTGRVIKALARPGLRVVGIEPVAALRKASGLPNDVLMDGDATRLPFPSNSFDVVCAMSVLHHIRHPEHAIAEMLRVGNAIFICDANNFAQGSRASRAFKQGLNALGLWPLANHIKTRGKGYTFTEGDGQAFSYSVFTNYRQIRRACKHVHLLNLDGSGRDPYRQASVIALLGIKR